MGAGHAEVRRSRRLVLSFISTVVNYEYAFYWYFYQVTLCTAMRIQGIIGMSTPPRQDLYHEFQANQLPTNLWLCHALQSLYKQYNDCKNEDLSPAAFISRVMPHMATHMLADCHCTFCWYFHQALKAQLHDPFENPPSASKLVV